MATLWRTEHNLSFVRGLMLLLVLGGLSFASLAARDAELQAVREASVIKVTDAKNSEGIPVWIEYWYEEDDLVMNGTSWTWKDMPKKYKNMLRLNFNATEMRDEESAETSPTGKKIAKGTTSFVVGDRADIYIGYYHTMAAEHSQLILDEGYVLTGDTLDSSIWVRWVMAKKTVEAGDTVKFKPEIMITSNITNVVFIRKAEIYDITGPDSIFLDWEKGVADGDPLTTDKSWVFKAPPSKFGQFSRLIIPTAIKDSETGIAKGPISFKVNETVDVYLAYTHYATEEYTQPIFDAGFAATGDSLLTDIWVNWQVTKKRFQAGDSVFLSEQMLMPKGNISLVFMAPASASIYDISTAAADLNVTLQYGVEDGTPLFPNQGWVFSKPPAKYTDCNRLWISTALKDSETGLPSGATTIKMSDWTEVFLCYTHYADSEFVQPIFDDGFVANGDTLHTSIWVSWVVTSKIFAPGDSLVLDGRMMIPKGNLSVVLMKTPLASDLSVSVEAYTGKFALNPYTWDDEYFFTDRDMVISYPYKYRGLVRIKTPNDFKNEASGTVTFKVNDDVTVLFAHNTSYGATLPQSYADAGFTELGDSIAIVDGAYHFRLYEKDYDKGETVTLGGTQDDNKIGGFVWTAFVKKREVDFLSAPVVLRPPERAKIVFSGITSSDSLEFQVAGDITMRGQKIYSDADYVWDDSLDYRHHKKFAGLWALLTPLAQKDLSGTVAFTTDTYSQLFLGLADSILPAGWSDLGFEATGMSIPDATGELVFYMYEAEFDAGTYTFGGSGLNDVGGQMWVLMGRGWSNESGATASEDFSAGTDDWVTDVGEENLEKWGVNSDGWYVMNEATTGKHSVTGEVMPLINDWSIWQKGWINGDFTLEFDLGMNIAASGNLAEVTHHLTHVAVVFCWQDEYNYYSYILGRSPGEDWEYEGLWKVKGGVRSAVYIEPLAEASMGEGWLEMEGLRPIQISRKGEVITVKLDGKIIAQGSAPDLTKGYVGAGEYNKGAVAIDNISLTPTAQAQEQWVHGNYTDLTFSISDSSQGYLTYADDGSTFASAPQGRWGKWVADGVEEGNLSWGSTGGPLRVHDLDLDSTYTMEAYVKLTSQDEYVYPYIPVMHICYVGGGGWRFGLYANTFDLEAKTCQLEMGFATWANIESPILTTVALDEWIHVAFVRDKEFYFFYVDKSEVGSAEIAPTDADSLHYPYAMLSMGKSSDIDVFKDGFINDPYMLVDRLRLSSRAIYDEAEFLGAKDSAGYVPEPPPTTLKGDYNEDGSLNIADVISLLLLGRSDPGNPKADFNGDGSYAINDAISLILYINSQSVAVLASARDAARSIVPLQGLSEQDVAYVLDALGKLELSEDDMEIARILLGLEPSATLPKAFSLKQNFPNPFNPSTTIAYDIPDGKTVMVSLQVFNLRGQLLRTLVDEEKEAGTYQIQWDGKDSRGGPVSSGIYFYRIRAGDFARVRKMVILK